MQGWYNVLRQTRLDLPRFVESLLATQEAEDWSGVRSPSRARRRLKCGFRQNVRLYRKPACFFSKPDNVYYIHPEMAKALRERTSKTMDRAIERELSNLFLSGSLRG